MKRKIAILLSAVLVAFSAAGCSRSTSPSQSGSSSSQSSSETSSVSIPDSAPTLEDDDGTVDDAQTPETDSEVDSVLQEVYDSVKAAYGENYVPSMMIETQMLSEVYKINMDNVDSFIAEGPMMSAHVDTFLALKAVDGKGEDVEKDVIAYQETQQNDALQYPMNQAKVNSSQVVRHGDYVFFVMLGAFDESESASEEEQLQFAQEQTKIGVDAIAEHF